MSNFNDVRRQIEQMYGQYQSSSSAQPTSYGDNFTNYWSNPGSRNEYSLSHGGDMSGYNPGYQDRLQDITDRFQMQRYGLSRFLPGMQYSPDQILQTYQQSVGNMGAMPMMQAPSIGGAQRYGLGAMGMANRAGALSLGQAATGMGGMSPAARAAALAQVSQGNAANAGQAGVQGMMQGGQWMQQAGLQNQQMQMQQRQMQQQLFQQALQQTMQAGLFGAEQYGQAQYGQMAQRSQERAENRMSPSQIAQLFGTLGQTAASAYSGGFGG
jgi:hypothetical protein